MRNVELKLLARHAGQERVVREASRFNVLMCGRRFGKTSLGVDLACEAVLDGKIVGWMAPSYKILSPAWLDLKTALAPIPGVKKNELEKVIRVPNGGSLEAWSLDGDDPARSRKFHRIIVDEAGLVVRLAHIFHNALRPTLADYRGGAWFLGTPKGVGDFSAMHAQGQGAGHDPEWASWCLPTSANPFISPDEIEAMRKTMPHETFMQEIMGIPSVSGDHPIGLEEIKACLSSVSTKPVVVWGVDLARSVDFTVAIGLDRDGAVAHLDRWKAPWGVTRERLQGLLGSTVAFIDSTGVGDPVVEELQRNGTRCVGVIFTARAKQHMVESLIVGVQQRQISFPDGWLRGELDSLEATKTQVGTRYAARQGLHDDGAMALSLAWKGFTTVIKPQLARARSSRGEVADGQSAGYDYDHNRPGRRETGEEALQRFLSGATFGEVPASPVAGRYRMPTRHRG